jgi:hypothetical protein
MHRKESLGLEVDDWIEWTGPPTTLRLDDDVADWQVVVEPGERGRVVAVRDGRPSEPGSDEDPTPAWALVEFEDGETAAVDLTMPWKKIRR